MMLVNGTVLAPVETKQKATRQGITVLERAVAMLRDVMPEYKKHTV